MRSTFLDDLRRPRSNIKLESGIRRLIEDWCRPGVHAVAIYRFGLWVQRSPLFVRMCLIWIYWFLERRIRIKWGIEINRSASIGGGFHIEHFGGVHIGGVRIGENCTIFHDVTFAQVFTGPRKGIPALGNNVIVYPGAKLIGRITLGNNVVVGPNVVLTRDVPDDGIVLVDPPKIIRLSRLKSKNA
jgi:serine O-acetyltransferase